MIDLINIIYRIRRRRRRGLELEAILVMVVARRRAKMIESGHSGFVPYCKQTSLVNASFTPLHSHITRPNAICIVWTVQMDLSVPSASLTNTNTIALFR